MFLFWLNSLGKARSPSVVVTQHFNAMIDPGTLDGTREIEVFGKQNWKYCRLLQWLNIG